MTHIFGGLRGEGEQKQIEIAATDSLKPWLRGGGQNRSRSLAS